MSSTKAEVKLLHWLLMRLKPAERICCYQLGWMLRLSGSLRLLNRVPFFKHMSVSCSFILQLRVTSICIFI